MVWNHGFPTPLDYKHPVFQILLDQRKLRTPTGIHFHVPNQALAVAVAHEWDSQVDTIKRYAMPLTTLCNRALDTPADQHDILVSTIMQYADTDTICPPMFLVPVWFANKIGLFYSV
ncbi:unnamed protein product [Schistosoma mattheei]|uniref:Uncharacterized protein n=1 Tax=Schistosoma mattheei TaxID=31246 RepID=A0A183PGR6_9TREM|nr:unnamed protein product [Schistosoma mattheei]